MLFFVLFLVSSFLQGVLLFYAPTVTTLGLSLLLIGLSIGVAVVLHPITYLHTLFIPAQGVIVLVTFLLIDLIAFETHYVLLGLGVLALALGLITTVPSAIYSSLRKPSVSDILNTDNSSMGLSLIPAGIGLILSAYYLRYYNSTAGAGASIFFWGFWATVPFFHMALFSALVLDGFKYKDRASSLDKRKVLLLEEKMGVDADVMKTLKDRWDSLVTTIEVVRDDSQEVVHEIETDSFEIPEPVKWLTLDEKYEYLEGLSEKIRARYRKDFTPMFHDSYIYEYARDRHPLDVLQSKGKNLLIEETTEQGKDISLDEEKTNEKLVSKYLKERDNGDINISKWSRDFRHRNKPLINYLRNINNEYGKSAIEREYKRIKAGVEGEKLLEETLDLFDDRFKVLTNVRVVVNDTSAESDAVVVSPFGVVTIEAKNFGSEGTYGIHVSKDGKWTKVTNAGRAEMKDTVAQSNRHVIYKQKLVNNTLKDRGLSDEYGFVDIDGIITIVNNIVELTNESDFPIKRVSHIYEYLRKQPKIYTDEQVETIYNIFKENMQPPQRFPSTDYEKQYEQVVKHFEEPIKIHTELMDNLGISGLEDSE